MWSTRARVLAVALALLAAALVVTVVADRALLLARLNERVDDDLAQEVSELERLAQGVDPETGEVFGDDVSAIFDTFFARNVPNQNEVFLGIVGDSPYKRSADSEYPIEMLDALVERWVSTDAPEYDTVTTPVGSMRTLVVPVTGPDGDRVGTFVVGRFPAEEKEQVDEAVRIAAAVGLAVFVLAAGAAWFVAGRVLSPLDDLSRVTASVGEDHLDDRVDVSGSGELAELGHAFNDMLERLEGAFASQRSFIDDAGHELRTPITVIRGHLEVADPDRPLGADTREIVFDELDRMSRIVDDLLLIAKSEQSDFVVPGPVDIADLTAEIVAKARPLADRDWRTETSAFAVVDVDRERIVQAWTNLARNAVQHTEPGDTITVFSRIVDGHLEVGVADTGEGVSAEDRDKIFERFGRGVSAKRTRSDGAGLGLAIVAAIAHAHGGTVELTDTDGGGATFSLRLPVDADDETEHSAEELTWQES